VLIAYLTTDEVNQDLAQNLAESCGTTLYLLTFQETPLDGTFDAVLYDWDYLPRHQRRRIQDQLLRADLPCPVAVHGYTLGEGQRKAFHLHDVAAHRRLEPGIFMRLRRVAQQAAASRPYDDEAERRAHPRKGRYSGR
jgi:hypothetical protein